jgi:hypothetical protein
MVWNYASSDNALPTKQTDSDDVWAELHESIARYELTQNIYDTHDKSFIKELAIDKAHLNDRIQNALVEVDMLRNTLTRFGLSKFHLDAEKLLNAGKESLRSLHTNSDMAKEQINVACKCLKWHSIDTTKKISKSCASLRLRGMTEYAENHATELESAMKNYNNSISGATRQFHWKNLVLSALLTLTVGLLMSLYIDHEWPWEMRAQIIKERHEGQALINAWSKLSLLDQQMLAKYV